MLLLIELIDLYSLLIVVRIIMSWINVNPYNPVVQFISRITDPYLSFFRQFIPAFGMLDLSPIVALFVLNLIKRLLAAILI